MAAGKVRTEFLFSYGTLQLEAVQMATFGRQLTGTSDALRGFELVILKIEDQTLVAIGLTCFGDPHAPQWQMSLRQHHLRARLGGRPS